MKFIKKKYKYFIAISLILSSFAFLIFLRKISLIRLKDSFIDLYKSIVYYGCSLFDIEKEVTVNKMPEFNILKLLPYDVDNFLRKFNDMWEVVFDLDCFKLYLFNVAKFLNDFSVYFMLFVPVVLILFFLIKKSLLSEKNKEHGEKSKELLFYENRVLPLFLRLKKWVLSIVDIFINNKFFSVPFIVSWLISFNILTVFVEFFAFYFYFAFSFDFANLFVQIAKFVLDILIMFSTAPLVFWLVVSYVFICIIRKNIGYRNLNHRQNINRQFVNSQPIMSMYCGTMGTGKTTALTLHGITMESVFREDALQIMNECNLLFPNMPWILFEDWLKKCIKYHHIYNLTTCRKIVEKRKIRFEKSDNQDNVFGYNLKIYPFEVEDGLNVVNLFDVLSDYACAYFIYLIQSSLILSNYSVRLDNSLMDLGNFPLWEEEYFKISPSESKEKSHFSHILDYDVLRLGMQVLKNNPRRGSLEFGVILLSEIGKERGNTLTLQDVKKSDDVANQKNDLFSYAGKMCRHKATIRGRCFVRIVADEQRPESLGADLRDLCNLIYIREKREKELIMPLFFFEEIIHGIFYNRLQSFFLEYRFLRSDYSLFSHFLHSLFNKFEFFYFKIYNIFGVSELLVDIEDGKMDGNFISEKIFLPSKLIYSNRFSTDCYRGYFEEQLLKTEYGFNDYQNYSDTVATKKELHYQNSYFISDLEMIEKGKK